MSYNCEQKQRLPRGTTQTQADGRRPHLQHGCTHGEDTVDCGCAEIPSSTFQNHIKYRRMIHRYFFIANVKPPNYSRSHRVRAHTGATLE